MIDTAVSGAIRRKDLAALRQAKEALEEQIGYWHQLPSGIDEEAEIENDSPEDAAAHVAGLAVQAARAAINDLNERLEGSRA